MKNRGFEVIHLAETGVIAASGGPYEENSAEGEIVPVPNPIVQTKYPAGLQ